MSIRIRVSTCRKESTTNDRAQPTFGSYGAGAAISFELDVSLLNDPAAFVGKIREHYALCESAMGEELVRLKAKANGNGTAAPDPAAAAAAPPAKRPVARQPVATPQRTAAQIAEEMADYEEEQARELPEDDDPPTDGRHLLGWASNQPKDAKAWLIKLGRKLRYPNRILNWTPKQVETAYQAFRQAHAQ
jgi:hypothetical protein